MMKTIASRYYSACDSRLVQEQTKRRLPPCSVLVIIVWMAVICAIPTSAQNIQFNEKSLDLGLRSNSTINPATQALEIKIPLGTYPGRAGLDVPVTLYYSSKVHRINFEGSVVLPPPPHGNGQTWTSVSARYGEHSVSGWTSSLDSPGVDTLSTQNFDMNGDPRPPGSGCSPNCFKVDRILVWMPDGSSHELRSTDQPFNITNPPPPFPDDLYAVDGSRLRYQRSTSTLFLPDGSRYTSGAHIDRNGNKLTVTDTLNRTIPNPLSGIPTIEPSDKTVSLPGVGGTVDYIFKWRKLGDPGVLSTPQPLSYIANSACPPGNGSYTPHLFSSTSNTCIANASALFNPVVLHRIELPTGQAYTFTYNTYGEIDKVVFPTGGYERYHYVSVGTLTTPATYPYASANRGVQNRWVSASGLGDDELPWQYSMMAVTAPDGSYTVGYPWGASNSNWGYGINSALAGRPYDERVYSATGQLLRRKLTHWIMTGSNGGSYPSGTQHANRNARVSKEVEILLDTGGLALFKTTTYQYDTTYEFSTGVNLTSTSEYGFFAIDQTTAETGSIDSFQMPQGTFPMRTIEKSYALEGTQSYRDRNLVGLVTSMRIKDANSNLVAQSTISYDEAAYPPISIPGTVTNWTDPGPGQPRGNVTTISHWRNTDNTYLSTHMRYDQCGSVRKLWDARDTSQLNPTEIDYSIDYHYAYPTTVTSADPDFVDPNNNGPLTPLVTSTEYDSPTGRVTASIDANGQRTTFAYNDPLNRLKQVVRASGDTATKNQTTYFYDDPGRTVTATSDLAAYDDNLLKAQTLYDKLGRATETRQYESGTTYIAIQIQYDTLGRVFKTSNPFRPLETDPPETPVWTTTSYDALGRVTSVTTPDNAVVGTAYSLTTSTPLGQVVTVTDQANKLRRGISDALGRLTRVDEPDTSSGTGNLGTVASPQQATFYSYDVLGNLTTVTQGTQTPRIFTYNSLKQLTDATNPESGHVVYDYDANGNLWHKTDARGVVTTHGYDKLNRPISRAYTDGTPDVIHTYDGGTNGKGWLTTTSSSVSSYSYSYDALGRALSGTQTTAGQDFAMSYGYDRAGNMTSQTYRSGRVVTTEYDSVGRIAGVKKDTSTFYYVGAAPTDDNRIQYSAHGAFREMRLGNGLWEHTIFNSRLQPKEIGLGVSSTDSSKLKLNYEYRVLVDGVFDATKNNGNVQSQTITMPGLTLTQSYSYDSLNRLKWAKEMSGATQIWKQTYVYDRFGNRNFDTSIDPDIPGGNTPKTTIPSLLTNLVIDPANNRFKLDAPGQSHINYDDAGNLKHDVGANGTSYTYDAENRLSTYNGGNPSSGGGSYSYDGDGRRVRKVTSGGTTVFVYNVTGQLVAEYTITAPTEVGGTSYLTGDHLGTPRVITQADSTVKSRHDYLPFGEEIFSSYGGRSAVPGYGVDEGIRQKFTSKERDNETGLDFFLARYYSSTQGRFTSPDPGNAGADVGDPQSWNGYAYSLNNPLRYIDPDGLRWAQAPVNGGIQYQWFDDYEKDANGQTAYARALASGWSAVTFNESGTLSFTDGLLAPGETLRTVTLSEDSPTYSVSTHTVTWGEWTKWLYLNTFYDLAFGTQRESAQLNDFVSSLVGVQTNASGDGPAVAGPAPGNIPEGPPHPRDTARKRGNELVEKFKKAGEGVGRSGGGGEKYKKAGAELIREANKMPQNALREAMKKEGKRLINYGKGVSHK